MSSVSINPEYLVKCANSFFLSCVVTEGMVASQARMVSWVWLLIDEVGYYELRFFSCIIHVVSVTGYLSPDDLVLADLRI